MNVVSFELDLDEPLQLLVGHHRRLLPGARRTSAPTSRRCSATSRGARSTREPARPALQRHAQGPDAVRDPVHRRDGLRLLPVHAAADLLQRAGARRASRQTRARAPSCARCEQRYDEAFDGAARRRARRTSRRSTRGERDAAREGRAARSRGAQTRRVRDEAKALVAARRARRRDQGRRLRLPRASSCATCRAASSAC